VRKYKSCERYEDKLGMIFANKKIINLITKMHLDNKVPKYNSI